MEAAKKGWQPERLRMAMDAAKMKKFHLAKKLGIHASQVARWLSGGTAPNAEHLVELCRVFGVRPEFFLAVGPEAHHPGLMGLAESLLGEPEARMFRAVQILSPVEKALLLEYIEGWIQARHTLG